MKLFILLFLLTVFSVSSYCQLNVSYTNATQFVQKLTGPNVSFANAVFSGTDPVQMGKFTGVVSPNIGITSGVILATGDAIVAEDVSNNCSAGTALGGGGDADLSGACQQQTKDLGAVEFDFWVPTDSVAFTFMFASEEYNYWVNSKNDVCGARLYNAWGGYANILYLPGTFTTICVNNINNGWVNNICDPSSGPCMNCQYFNDNTNGTTFQYNGYTDLITVKFHVTPCDTFHFWMGIADGQDFIYDSAILLPDDGFTGVGTTSGGCNPLPLALLSFTGTPMNDKNINETGKVNAAGNSTSVLSYEFIDLNLAPGTVKTYYRLKQVDFNGDFQYSKNISLNSNVENTYSNSVYPNPAQNFFNIELPGKTFDLSVTDITGRIVLEKKNISAFAQINSSDLHDGVYLIRASSGNNNIYSEKIVIQKTIKPIN